MVAAKKALIWSPEALTDLDAIWDFYVDAAGPHTAENLLRNIFQTCQLIEDYPLTGRTRSEVRPGLRSLAVPPHVVFYRVRDNVPEIMCVVDGRRDIDAVFENR